MSRDPKQQPAPLEVARAGKLLAALSDEVLKALTGKPDVVRFAITALIARGHLLVEDVPGVGKTTLARAISKAIGLPYRRLQFTSDLLPADVLGGSVYDPKDGSLSFRPGPVFTSVLLADEINRTTPRTQSALLEAMEERRVSLEGETRDLDPTFFVIATQNPEEFHGTYPLPESQLDRFLLRIEVGYPAKAVERAILRERRGEGSIGELQPILTRDELLGAQAAADDVRVDDVVLDYLHSLVLATRETKLLSLGASTRAALSWVRAVRAYALVSGRSYATPDDVQALFVPVIAHRVRLQGPASLRSGRDAARALNELLRAIPVPV